MTPTRENKVDIWRIPWAESTLSIVIIRLKNTSVDEKMYSVLSLIRATFSPDISVFSKVGVTN